MRNGTSSNRTGSRPREWTNSHASSRKGGHREGQPPEAELRCTGGDTPFLHFSTPVWAFQSGAESEFRKPSSQVSLAPLQLLFIPALCPIEMMHRNGGAVLPSTAAFRAPQQMALPLDILPCCCFQVNPVLYSDRAVQPVPPRPSDPYIVSDTTPTRGQHPLAPRMAVSSRTRS